MKLNLEELFSVYEVMNILDMPECSVVELLEGTLRWELRELVILAESRGMTLNDLLESPGASKILY